MRKSIATLLVSASFIACDPSYAAHAIQAQSAANSTTQRAPAETTGQPATGDKGIADIVVTANRRAENLQSVPLTISAFTAKALETQGVTSIAQIQNIVPGATLARIGLGSNTFLRGVGNQSSGYTAESEVATYLDGFYLPNSGSAMFGFNNIERVEVLKGPQGTLYGRNTTGGLISVVTRDPTDKARVDADVAFANFGTLSQNFYGSTPLGANLAANLSLTHTKQNVGWGRNVFTGDEVFRDEESGAAAKIVWKPTNRTKVKLQGAFSYVNTDIGNAVLLYPGARAQDGTPFLGRYLVSDRIPSDTRSHFYQTGLTIEQNLGFATFHSLTGGIISKGSFSRALNASPGDPLTPTRGALFVNQAARSRVFSQEFQLTSNRAQSPNFDWIAGLFYYRENTDLHQILFSSCSASRCSPPAPFAPTYLESFPKTRSYAAYAEGTYHVTDRDRITLGARYTVDHKTLAGNIGPVLGYPNSNPALPVSHPTTIETNVRFPKLTFRAVLAHDLSESVHTYASFNRGFKSGTYSVGTFTNPPTQPETLDAYEVGIKSDLFDHTLRFNASGFYYNFKNIQLATTAPPAPPGGSILYNATSAHLKGVDAEIVFRPSRSLTLNAAAEYLDAHYNQFVGASCVVPNTAVGALGGNMSLRPCDASGRDLPNAPKWSVNFGASYALQTSIGSLTLDASDAYKSRFYWTPLNRTTQNAYHLVNASITLRTPDGRADAQVFVRNLTKSYYFVQVSEGPVDSATPGAPRTYGIRLGYHF